MADLSSIQTLKNNLIRKSLNYSFFAANMNANVVDETLFNATTGALQTLPGGYKDLGYMPDDGGKFSTSISTQDVTSLQSTTPTRSDITGSDITLEVVCQETNLASIGIYTGTDWSSITPDPTSGVLKIDDPKVPAGLRYRLFGISQDVYQGSPVYIGRMLPQATVNAIADQSFGKSAENQWGVTFKALFDSAVGTAQRWLFGGEGWRTLLSDMGFGGTLPVVTAIDPTTLAIAGGDLFTITGQGFTGATGVSIDGSPVADFTVISDSVIAATAAAHGADTDLALVVTTAVGSSTGGPTVDYA